MPLEPCPRGHDAGARRPLPPGAVRVTPPPDPQGSDACLLTGLWLLDHGFGPVVLKPGSKVPAAAEGFAGRAARATPDSLRADFAANPGAGLSVWLDKTSSSAPGELHRPEPVDVGVGPAIAAGPVASPHGDVDHDTPRVECNGGCRRNQPTAESPSPDRDFQVAPASLVFRQTPDHSAHPPRGRLEPDGNKETSQKTPWWPPMTPEDGPGGTRWGFTQADLLAYLSTLVRKKFALLHTFGHGPVPDYLDRVPPTVPGWDGTIDHGETRDRSFWERMLRASLLRGVHPLWTVERLITSLELMPHPEQLLRAIETMSQGDIQRFQRQDYHDARLRLKLTFNTYDRETFFLTAFPRKSDVVPTEEEAGREAIQMHEFRNAPLFRFLVALVAGWSDLVSHFSPRAMGEYVLIKPYADLMYPMGCPPWMRTDAEEFLDAIRRDDDLGFTTEGLALFVTSPGTPF